MSPATPTALPDQGPDSDAIADLCERVRRFVDEVAIPAESVSYTHLTLPTILLV